MSQDKKDASVVIGDVFKLLTHLIERIFEEQRLLREILLADDKSGATDRLNTATGERYQQWEAIRRLEGHMAEVVISSASQSQKIDEIRDWLMPRSVKFEKWWKFWKSK